MDLKQYNDRNVSRNLYPSSVPRTWEEATNGGYINRNDFDDDEILYSRRARYVMIVVAAVFSLVFVFR